MTSARFQSLLSLTAPDTAVCAAAGVEADLALMYLVCVVTQVGASVSDDEGT